MFHKILYSYTDHIEPFGIDETLADITTTQWYTHVDIKKYRNAISGFNYGSLKKSTNEIPIDSENTESTTLSE